MLLVVFMLMRLAVTNTYTIYDDEYTDCFSITLNFVHKESISLTNNILFFKWHAHIRSAPRALKLAFVWVNSTLILFVIDLLSPII